MLQSAFIPMLLEMCIRDRVKMVADVYSHIIDEDRCINAQRLEEAF